MRIGQFLRMWEIEATDDPPEFISIQPDALTTLTRIARAAIDENKKKGADFCDPHDQRWCAVCGNLTDDGKRCRQSACLRSVIDDEAARLGELSGCIAAEPPSTKGTE